MATSGKKVALDAMEHAFDIKGSDASEAIAISSAIIALVEAVEKQTLLLKTIADRMPAK